MTSGGPRAYDAKAGHVLWWTIGTALLAALFVWVDFSGDLYHAHFHGRGAILNLLPGELRVAFFAAVTLAMLWACGRCVRLLFNPAVVVIDNEGIAAFTLSVTQRGMWKDFLKVEETSSRGHTYFTLYFRPPGEPSDKPRKVMVAGAFGADVQAIVNDAKRRVRDVGHIWAVPEPEIDAGVR